MYSEDTDYSGNQATTTSNQTSGQVEKEFSCRCGTVFKSQPDLDNHIMNSSYCYDFYMYHDN